jgi:hypothetical protein
MAKPIRILLSDDDENYFNDLQQDANRHNLIIEHARTANAGIKMLEESPRKYGGAIIDVNGLIDEDQTVDSANHVTYAIVEFKKICPNLPMVIATNDSQQQKSVLDLGVDKIYDQEIPVFYKPESEKVEEMFKFLKEQANKLPQIKIQNEFSDVFEIFDKDYLNFESRERLLTCIELRGKGIEAIKNNMISFRHLLSDIFKAMAKAKRNVIPQELLEPQVRIGDVVKHLPLSGLYKSFSLPDRYAHIINFAVSTYSAHIDEKTFKPTKYTYQSILFAMIDYLLWFKGWMDKNAK